MVLVDVRDFVVILQKTLLIHNGVSPGIGLKLNELCDVTQSTFGRLKSIKKTHISVSIYYSSCFNLLIVLVKSIQSLGRVLSLTANANVLEMIYTPHKLMNLENSLYYSNIANYLRFVPYIP